MDFTWALKYATEFFGNCHLIILGNGAVANVEQLKVRKVTKVAGSSSLLVMVWGL